MAIVIRFTIFDCAATQVLNSWFDWWKYALCAVHETQHQRLRLWLDTIVGITIIRYYSKSSYNYFYQNMLDDYQHASGEFDSI